MQEYSKKILVIEDDAINRNIFLDGLEAEGFYTIGAQNGIVGIQQAQEYLPDLVICNLMMPDIDGYKVLTTLRLDPVTAIIPFIFLADSDTKADFRKAMNLGADDYLTKPLTVKQLLRAIASRLEKQAFMRYWFATNCYKTSASLFPSTTSSVPESIFPSVPQLKEVFNFIEANYDQGISLCDVALAVGYSEAYLTNKVSKITGFPVNCWIVKRRMAAARSLLQDTNQTIEHIATALGYQNVCHFSRQFRQHHEVSPQTWRNSCVAKTDFELGKTRLV